MSVAIEVYPKQFGQKINRGHKAAISRKVRKLGFDTEWDGNTIIVTGAYYGLATEAINELGFQTDDDQIEDAE